MIYLIRSIERHDSGSVEHRDKEIQGDEITVGRATDQDIQLVEQEVALHHAIVQLRGKGKAFIKAATSSLPLIVNGGVSRSAALKPGDAVQIGGSRIGVFDPPEGFDFALTLERASVELEGEDAPVPGSQYVTTLAETGLRKRPWAWALFLVIFVGLFIVPAAGLFNPGVQAFLRKTPFVPDDGAWSPGTLIPAHNVPELSEHCNVCHVKPFVSVRDEQCIACHDDMMDHVVTKG